MDFDRSTRMSAIRALALISAAPAAIMLSAIAAPAAMAQASATEAGVDEGAIVVTARRREERLLDVPVAVTSLSGDQLAKAGAIDITDIAQSAPNVTLEASRGTNSTLSAFIRGIGQQDPVSGFEQGVGIYLDDVYLNRPQAAVLDIYDVERIEVLRGPQGTLYGRNTIGGAVKYVTKQLPQEFSLRLKGTVGNYEEADGIITVSAPLGEIARVGGSVARLSRGGFGKNLTLGIENYNKDIWAGRATLEIGGYGEPVLMRISGDYTKDNSYTRGGHRLIPGLQSGTPVLSDVYDTQAGLNFPKQYVEAYGLSANITAELGSGFTLRSISAWRKDNSVSLLDLDALPAVDFDVPSIYRNEQTSQEFQILYDDGGPLKGMIGGYYLTASADTFFDAQLFTTAAGLAGLTQAYIDTDTFATFGDFTYDFSEQFSLSLGGRYTWDKRTGDMLRQNLLGGGSKVFGGTAIPFGAPGTDYTGSRKFNKFTPRVSVSFKPTRDHNIYASYSQGFKGGGFDPRGVGANAPDLNGDGIRQDSEVVSYLTFRPEKVDSYEIGYKASFFDNALYIALAGFYMDYTDVQIPGSSGCTVAGVPTFCGVVTNAGKARIQGIELETRARLARDFVSAGDRLTFSGALGYVDAKYKEYLTLIAGTTRDVADFRKVQNTPKWTASSTLSYAAPLASGDIDLSTTLAYRSKTYQFEIANPYLDQKGYALIDASIVYTAPDDRWSIGIFGKNLADKRYKTSGFSFVAVNPTTGAISNGANGFPVPTLGKEGTLVAYYGNPRQVFITGTINF